MQCHAGRPTAADGVPFHTAAAPRPPMPCLFPLPPWQPIVHGCVLPESIGARPYKPWATGRCWQCLDLNPQVATASPSSFRGVLQGRGAASGGPTRMHEALRPAAGGPGGRLPPAAAPAAAAPPAAGRPRRAAPSAGCWPRCRGTQAQALALTRPSQQQRPRRRAWRARPSCACSCAPRAACRMRSPSAAEDGEAGR